MATEDWRDWRALYTVDMTTQIITVMVIRPRGSDRRRGVRLPLLFVQRGDAGMMANIQVRPRTTQTEQERETVTEFASLDIPHL